MAVEVRARLRAFGNGNDPWFGVMARVVLEAVDNQPFGGASGMVTHHTQADFDDFRATVP